MKLRIFYVVGLLQRRRSFYSHRHFSTVPNRDNAVELLCKNLNITESIATRICMKYPVVTKLNGEKIRNVVNTINELGYSNETLVEIPTLFGILPVTLKFRFNVLNECGLYNITPSHLLRYLTIVRQKSIAELKKAYEIPMQLNVENRLASYMTQWPTSLTTLIYEDVNSMSLYALRFKIIQRYLELVLDLTQEEFKRGIKTYPTIKHRPLKVINETLQILQSQILIPTHKIKSNLYLVHVDPENLKEILYKLKSIGGIDIKEIIRAHPRIATKNCSTLVETKKILQEYNISNEAQIRCFNIYTLGSETVRERLKNAQRIPEISTFINHPRFLKIIYHNRTVKKRMEKLYSCNKKCLSLNILSGSAARYESFEKAPGDRLGKGKDLLFCISQLLGNKYNISYVRNTLKRHPFWINIPLIQVKYVYQKLAIQFITEDIYNNCSILLYPWNKINGVLNVLSSNKLHTHFPFFHENMDIDKISDKQKLSLVLYLLEKNHYFSGNGVWTEEKNKNNDCTNL